MKNWKTTLAAILAAAPQILHYLFPNTITLDVANVLSGLFVSLGLVAAKDNNVTGGTKQQ